MMFSLSSDNRDIRIVCARLTGWITENWQILAKTLNITSNFRRNVRALLNLRFSMKQPHSTAWLGDRKAEKSSRRPGKLRSNSLISPYSCKDSIAYSNIYMFDNMITLQLIDVFYHEYNGTVGCSFCLLHC